MQFIINNTAYMPNNSTIYYRLLLLKNNITNAEDLPRCKKCGKLLEDNNIGKYFAKGFCFCSAECYHQYPKSEEYKKQCGERMKKIWDGRDDEYKKEFYKKVENTNIERYGTKCTLNTEENIKKKKETWERHYGVDNPLKAKVIKDKVLATNNDRYGSNCPLNNPKIKEKALKTLYANYMVNNIMHSDVIKEKIKKTSQEKYGVDWPSQSDKFWEKYANTMDNKNFKIPKYRKYHTYKFKSGKEILVLGYEDLALDFYILNYYTEDDIENTITYMNKLGIKYIDKNDKSHRYIPDFYIKSKNLIIEVKSAFTFFGDLDKISRKTKAALDNGYNIITIVFEHVDRKKLNIKYKLYSYEDIKIEKEKYC